MADDKTPDLPEDNEPEEAAAAEADATEQAAADDAAQATGDGAVEASDAAESEGGAAEAQPEAAAAEAPRKKDPKAAAAATPAKARTSEELARMLGVETDDDPILDESIRAASQDLSEFADEFSDARQRTNKTATIIIFAAVAVLVGGVAALWANPKTRYEMECFLSGDVERCKMEDKRAQEAKWAEVERLQRNLYGNTELIFSPQDAKAHIKVLKYVEGEKPFMARAKTGVDARAAPAITCDIDNPSLHLEEKQTVKKIAFPTLPIQEKLVSLDESSHFIAGCICSSAAQCGPAMTCGKRAPTDETMVCLPKDDAPAVAPASKRDDDSESPMASYRYLLHIEKEGYKPRRFIFAMDPIPDEKLQGEFEGASLLRWEKLGPGTYVINFPGADLEPEPETAKKNVRFALIDFHCQLPKEKDEAARYALEEQIRVRYGFSTTTQWERITELLQRDHKEWWDEVQKELPKIKCE